MSLWVPPTATEFKAFFNRDFNYAPASDATNDKYVTDVDIDKAITEADINFSPGMFKNFSQSKVVCLYLAAFFLVVNIQNSQRGLSSQANFPINSNSVQGVAIAVQIPERFLKDPFLSQFTQNGYGMKYLTFVLPYLVGNVRLMFGTTTST